MARLAPEPGSSAPSIQRRIELGKPDDRFEREADRVADQVLRMADPQRAGPLEPRGNEAPHGIQRLCAECEEELRRQPVEDEEEQLQMKRAPGATAEIGADLEARIAGLRGRGQPLSPSLRAFFEPRFGHDFGKVRLHTDQQAADSARVLNALAYTVGTHIVFGSGQFATATSAGQRLLAHELTHVVQQRQNAPVIQRKITFTAPSPSRENPIKRVLSEPTLGFTLPTVNGTALPNGIQNAGQLLFSALQPQQTSYDAASKGCRFAEFDVDVSANVTVITQPEKNQWTLNLPGTDIKGIAACHSQSTVPVTMTGKPDSQSIVNLVDQYEQEHVTDLKQLYANHLETHFNWLMGLRAQGEDSAKCQATLLTTLGKKDALAVDAFLKDWLAAVAARDAKGGHTLKNMVTAAADCTRVTIETSK